MNNFTTFSGVSIACLEEVNVCLTRCLDVAPVAKLFFRFFFALGLDKAHEITKLVLNGFNYFFQLQSLSNIPFMALDLSINGYPNFYVLAYK